MSLARRASHVKSPANTSELLRYRRKLVESRTAERDRTLRLLETANIKLASVASDVFGISSLLKHRLW